MYTNNELPLREKKSRVGDFIFPQILKMHDFNKNLALRGDTQKYEDGMHKDADNLSVSYNAWIWAKIKKKNWGEGVKIVKKKNWGELR